MKPTKASSLKKKQIKGVINRKKNIVGMNQHLSMITLNINGLKYIIKATDWKTGFKKTEDNNQAHSRNSCNTKKEIH